MFKILEKNNLDEMQENKMKEIEHYGFWFLYWGTLVVIMVEMANKFNELSVHFGLTWILFMAVSVYMVVASLKNGLWDRRLKPDRKTNLFLSLGAGSVIAIFFILLFAIKLEEALWVGLLVGAIGFAFTAGLTFVLLTLCGKIYQKKVDKLEDEDNAE